MTSVEVPRGATLLSALQRVGFVNGTCGGHAGCWGCAVELDDGNARTWADLGLALAVAADPAAARRALDRSIELDPSLPTAWYNRGLLNLRAGRYAEAESDLEEAIRRAPDNPELVDLLQRAHRLHRQQEREQRRESRQSPEDSAHE